LLVEFRELGIARKLGIEHQGGLEPAVDIFPEREKGKDLIIGFGATDVGGGIEHQFGFGVLGKEGKGAFHGFASRPGPVLFQDGFFAIMGDGVEIEVDDLPVVESETMALFNESFLKSEKMHLIQRVGIGG